MRIDLSKQYVLKGLAIYSASYIDHIARTMNASRGCVKPFPFLRLHPLFAPC